ncbi:unnamed protein product [Hymenolepis diminuta]|uniref:Snake toxin/toxin-like domain-containing protein n=1 Tax=Hymenolepis diminuta TaxID=6216 RepID=A0A564YU71_HYMDI|nr:unnamed protein product [Hymenolepis diminuta]
MLGIIKAVPLLLIAFPLCLSLDCYKCRNCSSDRSSWKKYSPCGYCSIETTYADYEVINIDRKCTKSCLNLESIIKGSGRRVECCKENLCNSANSQTLQSLLLAILILIATSQFY